MHEVPSPDPLDQRHDIRTHQATTRSLVFGYPPNYPGENRHFGLGTQAADWRVLQHRLGNEAEDHASHERDDGNPLGGAVQLDDVYWGGERHGGKRGRGSENKTPFVAAVALDGDGYPVAMNVAKGFWPAEIARWAKQHLKPGSLACSDGLACFSAVTSAGCDHYSIVTGGGPHSVSRDEFAWVNTMTGNVKRAINGICHAINPKPRYLAGFCYRFNRRFQLGDMLPRFAFAAARTPPMPGRLLKLAETYG